MLVEKYISCSWQTQSVFLAATCTILVKQAVAAGIAVSQSVSRAAEATNQSARLVHAAVLDCVKLVGSNHVADCSCLNSAGKQRTAVPLPSLQASARGADCFEKERWGLLTPQRYLRSVGLSTMSHDKRMRSCAAACQAMQQ